MSAPVNNVNPEEIQGIQVALGALNPWVPVNLQIEIPQEEVEMIPAPIPIEHLNQAAAAPQVLPEQVPAQGGFWQDFVAQGNDQMQQNLGG